MSTQNRTDDSILQIVERFSARLGGIRPSYYIKKRPDGQFLIFEFAKANNRFYKILEEIESELPEENLFRDRCVITERSKKPDDVLSIPETQLLQRAIAESLTIDRHSFGQDFFSRYTPSVTNFEQQIVSSANYVVYGRRGAGKSSLLAYGMHRLAQRGSHFSWVAMQAYVSRSDEQVIASVIAEILSEIKIVSTAPSEVAAIIDTLNKLSESDLGNISDKLGKLTPRIRRIIQSIATTEYPFTIFLDDFHVISDELQPKLLSSIYSISRGNNTFIKLSGIEQFTRTWDDVSRQGLQPPHDAQIMKLDLNLTMPDRSKTHIVSILDAHAIYCGLPKISYLASEKVLSRLVLEAAAVPRDALGLFSQAINKAYVKGQKSVSLVSLNAAASEMAEEKLKDIEKDTSDDLQEITALLDRLKNFCITVQKKNAFLIKIKNNDSVFKLVQKLIALRLVHVLHEGITPHKAGQRYMALMLDYGFYIGVRASKSVELFPTTPQALLVKDLRKLPIFT
jgi:hypothetical protein